MPTKKIALTDAERAKRIREAAREHGTDNDPAAFERAFAAVERGAQKSKRETGTNRGEFGGRRPEQEPANLQEEYRPNALSVSVAPKLT